MPLTSKLRHRIAAKRAVVPARAKTLGRPRVDEDDAAADPTTGEHSRPPFPSDVRPADGAQSGVMRTSGDLDEHVFRGIAERSPDAILIQRRGRIVYANARMAALLGYPDGAALAGCIPLDLVHDDDRSAVRAHLDEVAARVDAPGDPRATRAEERQFVRCDHGIVSAELTAFALARDGEPALVWIARDTSERKQLTAKMMQLDRMIAVGTLAAGVGHEINNPLAYVIANLDYIGDRLPQIARDETVPADLRAKLCEIEEVFGEVREGADRVRRIVRDLRTLSRSDDQQTETLRVEQVLDSAANIAWNEIRYRARLVKDYRATPPVLASESRLGQVFLNLLINAAQAIRVGSADQNEIRIATWHEGDRVAIEIGDTGIGIAPENLRRIFDPFFTTKPVGQGTGLGLSICQGIVGGLGGEITVTSEPGKGARFRVLLPIAKPSVPGLRAAKPILPR